MRHTIVIPLAAAILVGCSGGNHDSADSADRSPGRSSSGSVASPPAGSSAASSSPAAAPFLPASCADLLGTAEVSRRLGKPLPGQTTYLKAAPLPSAGRTGRVTCGYGVVSRAGAPATPPVAEASYITYVDAATAARRINTTVSRARANGSGSASLTVAGKPGFVVADPRSTTVLFADGSRTYVVTLLASAARGNQATDAGIKLATVMRDAVVAAEASASPQATASP